MAVDPDPPASSPRSNVDTKPSVDTKPPPPAKPPPLTASTGTSRREFSRVRVVGGIILLSAAVWGGVRLMHGRAGPGPAPDANTAGTEPVLPQPVSHPARRPSPQVSTPSDPILHKEIPGVAHSALRTIRGQIQVLVSVTVDTSGSVVDETLEHPGSSKYFARVSTAAARKWRFAPATGPGARKWLLRFEFTRTGVSASAALTS
jgi:TonB family protein